MAFGKKQAAVRSGRHCPGPARPRRTRSHAAFQKGITALRDFIAPSSIEFSSTHFQLGTRYARTYYVYGYPRQIYTGWLSSMVNLDEVIDMTMYVYPVESQVVLENLRKKVTQLEAGIQIDAEKGRVRDPGKQAAILDAEEMRDKLQVGEERFFRFGLYFTIYASSMEELEFVSHKVETMLGQQLVYFKAGHQPARAGPKQHRAAVYRPATDSPQHEHRRLQHQLSVHQRRPNPGKRHFVRHQHAQLRPGYF